MPTTTKNLKTGDEVARWRRIRRMLEQQHGGFDGLCAWLAGLQKCNQGKPIALRKSHSSGKKNRR